MAPMEEPPVPAEGSRRCYYCGFESAENTFKYYDNKKLDQPRFKCNNCKKFFTSGWHGRPQGKTYAKKRNQDPLELRGLPRECRHCGVADNAAFKHYNNKSLMQPRFKCLSCGKQFQMRLLVDGDVRRLVHTSSKHKQATDARKNLTTSCNASNSDDEMNLPCDGMPAPVDPGAISASVPCEPEEYTPQLSNDNAHLLDMMEPQLSYEDLQGLDFMEPSLSDEHIKLLNLIEADFNNEINETESVKDVGMTSSATDANLDVVQDQMVESAPRTFIELLESSLSNEDAEFLHFVEAGFSDVVNEAEAVKDVDTAAPATSANLGVAQDQMVESAPGTIIDLMESSLTNEDAEFFDFVQTIFGNKVNEAEVVIDVDMASSATDANLGVAQDQIAESAPEIYMGQAMNEVQFEDATESDPSWMACGLEAHSLPDADQCHDRMEMESNTKEFSESPDCSMVGEMPEAPLKPPGGEDTSSVEF